MTFRSQNRIIELEGENYVRGIVQSFNSIFQVIDGRNDQGNDVYVEFVVQNRAMNFGFFAQIKSGTSYKDNSGYKIPANRDHLQYWNQALYPMLGMVFDPELKKRFGSTLKNTFQTILKFCIKTITLSEYLPHRNFPMHPLRI